jgi:hypothetical protein
MHGTLSTEDNDSASAKKLGHKEDSWDEFGHNGLVSGNGFGIFGNGLVKRIGLKCLAKDLG